MFEDIIFESFVLSPTVNSTMFDLAIEALVALRLLTDMFIALLFTKYELRIDAFVQITFVFVKLVTPIFSINILVPVILVEEMLTPPDLSPIVSIFEELIEDVLIPL